MTRAGRGWLVLLFPVLAAAAVAGWLAWGLTVHLRGRGQP